MPAGGNDWRPTLEKLEDRVRKLETWRSWIMGLGMGSMWIVGVATEWIRHKLGIAGK